MDNSPAKLSQDITFEWSPELVKTSTRRFIWRHSRRTQAALLVMLALGIFCIVKGLASGWIMIGFCVLLVLLWVRHYFKTINVARERPDRGVTVCVEPDSITFRTSEKESTLTWSQFREVWSAPDVLLLFPHGSKSYIVLPVDALGEDLRRYIETNVRQNGGKVA